MASVHVWKQNVDGAFEVQTCIKYKNTSVFLRFRECMWTVFELTVGKAFEKVLGVESV